MTPNSNKIGYGYTARLFYTRWHSKPTEGKIIVNWFQKTWKGDFIFWLQEKLVIFYKFTRQSPKKRCFHQNRSIRVLNSKAYGSRQLCEKYWEIKFNIMPSNCLACPIILLVVWFLYGISDPTYLPIFIESKKNWFAKHEKVQETKIMYES